MDGQARGRDSKRACERERRSGDGGGGGGA
jgi:hypothetical protein